MQRRTVRYVARIRVRTASFLPPEERHELETPDYFNVTRGYWQADTTDDGFGTQRPDGVLLTTEFDAANHSAAEDAALEAGSSFAAFIAAHSGSPFQGPTLVSVAEVDRAGYLVEQRTYSYLDQTRAWPRVQLDPAQLSMLIRRTSRLENAERSAVGLALRWYGISVGASDALDSLLAAWIGLEAIGKRLHNRFHPTGGKAPCPVCRNPAGTEIHKDRKFAGLIHLFNLEAPEMLAAFPFNDIKQTRDNVAHGLTPRSECWPVAEGVIDDLLLCLGVGILTAARPEGAAQGVMHSALPREFAVHPDSMAWIRLPGGSRHFQPYLGEWIELNEVEENVTTRVDGTGHYTFRSRFSVVRVIPVDLQAAEHGLTLFVRRGHDLTFLPGGLMPETRPWRERETTAAWNRALQGADEGEEDAG